MNKNDFILIGIVLVISISFFLVFKLNESDKKVANVYYEDKVVLTIPLNDNETNEYKVKGFNGDVIIETLNGKIKVREEKSPLHLCSKQGYISNSYESIVCLPNKVVIKIEDSESLDAIVG